MVSGAIWRSDFWRWWVAANAFAELFGLGAVATAGLLLFQQAGEPDSVGGALAFAAVFVVLGGFEGLVVGVAQNAVLRTRLPAVHGWVRATVAGAMVAWALGMVPSTVMNLMQGASRGAEPAAEPALGLVLLLAAGLGAVAGPVLAAFQWRVLRKVILRRAWQWLPANAAAWALGMPVIFLGAQANEITADPLVIAGIVALALFAAGALVGAVHGWILLRMLRVE